MTNGVTIDQELTFADHIRRLTGRCFHCLRQLRLSDECWRPTLSIPLWTHWSSVGSTTVRSARWRTRRPPAAAPTSSQCCSSTDRSQVEVRQHLRNHTWRSALAADLAACRL